MAHPSSADMLLAAVRHHEAGQLAEAEALYRRILEGEPDHPDATHLLGVALLQQNQPDPAIELIRRAIALRPNNPAYHSNLGYALNKQGKLDEAFACCRQALALNPNFADAHVNLGNVLKNKGLLGEAMQSFRRALGLNPNHLQAQNDLGVTLAAAGQTEEALGHLRQAIAINPNFADAHCNLGYVLRDLGRSAEAIAALRESLRLKPDNADARFSLAALTGEKSVRAAPADYVRTLFDEYAPRFDAHLIEQLQYRSPRDLLEDVLKAVPDRRFAILDLGCGTGLCGLQFKPHARSMTGVDLSPRMIEVARQRAIYDRLIVGELNEALRERPRSYDLVLAGDVFVYIGDLAETFALVREALVPGGLFAFTVEAAEQGSYVLNPSTRRFAHSIGYLSELAGANGFAQLSVRSAVIRMELGKGAVGYTVVLQLTPAAVASEAS
jgi:predicted TPR repeat methyltransferase